jgi:hypothetical protein
MIDELDILDVDCEEDKKDKKENNDLMVEYTRNRNHCYLWLSANLYREDKDVSQMLNRNRIKWLLPMMVSNENGINKCRYEITSLISFDSWAKKRSLGVEELRMVFHSIYTCTEALEEYFLDLEHLILEPQYIFIDERDSTCWFLFFQGYQKEFTKSLQEILRFFMDGVDVKKRKDVECIYAMYEILQNPNYQLEEVMKQMYEVEKETQEPSNETISEYEEVEVMEEKNTLSKVFKGIGILALLEVLITVMQIITRQIDLEDIITILRLGVGIFICVVMLIIRPKKKVQEKSVVLDDLEVEYESPMTTILYENPSSICLKNCDGKEKDINIDQEEFIVGKVASVTNAQVNNNAISRMHVKFYKKEDEWKIMDLCSTNGTYLNGERLRGEKEYVVKDGDQIRLANIEYIFCVK